MSEYLRPASLQEAVALRSAHPEFQVLAGGTDLLVASRHRQAPAGIIDLFGLSDLTGIAGADGVTSIGATTTYQQILASSEISKNFPILSEACREIGAAQIQARGTIGGNVANSSPVGDTLPVLLALDATIVAVGSAGERKIPYSQFCTGYRKTALRADELIRSIELPRQKPGAKQVWRKVGTRRAQSISKVMMAAVGHREGATAAEMRVAFGAMADRPLRIASVEELVVGKSVDAALIKESRSALAKALQPIDDVRSSADYRLEVAQNLVARFLEELAG
jgi:xanthine dehydrogenase small subunit